jgi:DNA-binding transcriptional MerR regulator
MGPITVSELARLATVSPDAVRYYARTGLLTPERNPMNGYREFSASDVRRLRFIKRAQSLGFSLGEIATIIQTARQRKSPCPLARDIIKRHIGEAGEELERLIRLRDRMKKAMAKWKRMPDGIPDGDEICRLIEATGEEDAEPLKHRLGGPTRVGAGNAPGLRDRRARQGRRPRATGTRGSRSQQPSRRRG